MADQKLLEAVGKYIDKYYEPAKDDIKLDKEMLSVFDKITEFRQKRVQERAAEYKAESSTYELGKSAVEKFDVSTMKKTKIKKGMSSTLSVSRNLDNLMDQLEETFSQRLLRMIDERGLTDSQVYTKAYVDRRHFSKIRKDVNYVPNKKTVLAFTIALELSLDEAKDLLDSAGFALSRSSKTDIIVAYFLQNKIYDGVMIFFDELNNKVLIRNKDKNYFLLSSCEDKEELNIEKDYHGNEIGFFTEYKLDSGDSLINYFEMLEQENGREIFLRLIFEEGMYNILFEDFIIKKQDGNYASINPFCKNDNSIIKGKTRDKYSRVYDKKNILDALSSHRTMALKISKKCIMNRVSLGLAILLLQHENVEIDALGLDTFSEDEWYQDQLLRNWVKKCKDPINSISFILEQWQKENVYCEHIFSNKKIDRPNVETHEIEPLDFYPLKSKLVWIYQNLCIKNPEDCYLLNGRMKENDDGENIICVDLNFDMLWKKLKEKKEISELNVKIEEIEDPDEVFANPYADASECYFLYDSKENRSIIYEPKLLKNLSAVVTIQKNNQFTLEVAKKIGKVMKIYDAILNGK